MVICEDAKLFSEDTAKNWLRMGVMRALGVSNPTGKVVFVGNNLKDSISSRIYIFIA